MHPEPAPESNAAPIPDPETRLVQQFWGRLRVFAARRLGDAALAEDVAQETLRRVVDALRAGRVRDRAALPGFVFETARHICQQHARSSGREARALSRLGQGGMEPPGMPDALAALISAERRFAVRRALERLDAEERTLLAAFYYEQVDAEALGRRLGITAGAVRVRKHRALKRLAELLAGGGG